MGRSTKLRVRRAEKQIAERQEAFEKVLYYNGMIAMSKVGMTRII